VIGSSVELLYAIDFKYFHITPTPLLGPGLPVATRRKLPPQSETAWQKIKIFQRYRISFQRLVYYMWSRGVLEIKFLEKLCFVQLPSSPIDHTDIAKFEREWSNAIDYGITISIVFARAGSSDTC
jgi:hypothetical protein